MPATANPYWALALEHPNLRGNENIAGPLEYALGHYLAGLERTFGGGKKRTSADVKLTGTTLHWATLPSHTRSDQVDLNVPARVPRATMVKAYEQAITQGPFAKIEQATAQQLMPAFSSANAYVSGAMTPMAETGAFSQALQALQGASGAVGKTPSQWLAGNVAAGNAVSAPIQHAAAAYGAANEAHLPGVLAELNALGQGNEAAVMTAPENAWLNAIISGIQSHLEYYGTVPRGGVSGFPSAIGKALLGLGGPTGGATAIPITALTTKGATIKVPRGSFTFGATGAAGGVPPGVTQPPAGGGTTVHP